MQNPLMVHLLAAAVYALAAALVENAGWPVYARSAAAFGAVVWSGLTCCSRGIVNILGSMSAQSAHTSIESDRVAYQPVFVAKRQA